MVDSAGISRNERGIIKAGTGETEAAFKQLGLLEDYT